MVIDARGPLVGIDFETFAWPAGGPPVGQPVCVALATADSVQVLHCRDPRAERAVAWCLRHAVVTGFNLAFDLDCIALAWPHLVPHVYACLEEDRAVCTKTWETLHKLATEGLPDGFISGTSLAGVAKSLLGRDMAKGADSWQKRYGELWDAPVEQWPADAVGYSAGDAIAHRDVAIAMQARDFRILGQVVPALHFETRSAFGIRRQEVTGLPVDPVAVERLGGQYDGRLKVLTHELQQAGLLRPDRSRDTRLIQARVEAALTAQGINIAAHQNSKGTSIASDVIELCRDPALQALAEHARVQKYLSTYLRHVENTTAVYPRWQPLVSTGRTSCSKPPAHQWPKDAGWREVFCAPPGWAFVVADFAAAELRHLAAICVDWFGFSDMRDAFARNVDVHAHFGAQLLGLSYDEFERRRAADDPDVKKARDMAKPANFGWPTRMGTERFMASAHNYGVAHLIDPNKVPEMRELWAATWREMPLYWREIAKRARRGETFAQPWSGRLRAGCSFTVLANQPFQGGTADAAKLAAYFVRRASDVGNSVLRHAHLLHSVHDEIILASPEGMVHEVAQDLSAIMVWAATTVAPNCTHGVDVVATRRWSKHAKRVVRNGRLCVWEG